MAEPSKRNRFETEMREVKDALSVLRREAIENRAVMRRLIDVLRDLHTTNEGLRLELQYVRTQRERMEHLTDFEKAANQGGTNG